MRKPDLFRLLALLVLPAAVLLTPLLLGEVLVGRDLLAYYYPRFEVLGETFARGEVPRWNPWSGHGASWFGPRAGGVLYPGILLFAALPARIAMGLFLLAHVLIALVGMRCLARHTGGSETAAGAAAVAYGLGGFVISQAGNPPYLISAAFLPWVALAGLRAGERPLRSAAGVGLAVGLTLLAAEPQGALLLALVAAGLALSAAPERRGASVGFVALGVLLGAAAAGPQLLSILDEAPRTDRGLALADARWGLAGRALALQLVAPGALGEFRIGAGATWGLALWDGRPPWCGIAIGGVGLAACLTALADRSRRDAWAPTALIVLGVLFAAVRAGEPLGLRFPAKWLVLSAFGAAWTVGLGFARWQRGEGRGFLPGTLGAIAALSGAGLLFVLVGGEGLERTLADLAPGRVDGAAARGALREALVRALALAVMGLAVWRRALPWRRTQTLLLGLLALELSLAAHGAVVGTKAPVLEQPPLPKALAERHSGPAPIRYEARPDRLLNLGGLRMNAKYDRAESRDLFLHALLQTSECYREGIRAVRPFEAVHARAQTALERDPAFAQLPRPIQLALLDAELIPVTLKEARDEQKFLRPAVGITESIGVARNLACPPWAYLVAHGEVFDDEAGARRRVLDPRRYPQDVVVLSSGTAESAAGPEARGRVTVERFEPERIELTVSCPSPRWLVVREAFSPDWVATVDGAAVAQRQADLLYRAIRLPAGEHTVEMRYQPWWWWPGLALLALGWLSILVLGVRGASR